MDWSGAAPLYTALNKESYDLAKWNDGRRGAERASSEMTRAVWNIDLVCHGKQLDHVRTNA